MLLIIDSFIQKSLLPYFTSKAPLEPDWFKITNPYFWHPFKGIIVTVTIYLMVAISAERFRAVCYPLSKRQVSHASKVILNLGKNHIYSFIVGLQSLKSYDNRTNPYFSRHTSMLPW